MTPRPSHTTLAQPGGGGAAVPPEGPPLSVRVARARRLGMRRQDVLKIVLIYLVLLSLAMAVLYFFTHVLLGLPLWYVRIVIGTSATLIAIIIIGAWTWAYSRRRQ